MIEIWSRQLSIGLKCHYIFMDTGRGSRSGWGHSVELNLHNASSPSLFLDPNLDRIHLTRYPCRSIAIRRTATLFIVYLYMLECWKLDSGWYFWGRCRCTVLVLCPWAGRPLWLSIGDGWCTDGVRWNVESSKPPQCTSFHSHANCSPLAPLVHPPGPSPLCPAFTFLYW